MKFTIEPALASDVPAILQLIKQLAIYERAENEVTVTAAILEEDGFGPNKIFDCFIARSADNHVLGLALYYTKYSTWKGRCIYLEDIIVDETYRGNGIGKELFRAVYDVARQRQSGRLEWQVLEWNEPAIGFYKRFKSQFDSEWINCKFTYEQLQTTRAEEL
jgi:GNAT superfamily N-acetyltransferase